MHYFAYGSNMSEKRLQSRIPAAREGVAVLPGYRLRFTKPGELDGSAKCDILKTDNPKDEVLGVLYTVQEEHMPILDRIEGLGFGYRSETLTVYMKGEPVRATAYIATGCDHTLKPYNWYKAHVLAGAVENKLPEEYIEAIRAVDAREDPDRERHSRELSIYPDINI